MTSRRKRDAATFKRLRLASGLSVEAMAAKLRISRQGLHLIEQGRRGASFETVRRLVATCGESLAIFD